MSAQEISQIDLTQGMLFPAQSITSMCQEAQHVVDDPDSEVSEDIAHVLNSSKKLANLISDHISTIENTDTSNGLDTRTIRHDMKNPLNVVLGCSKLIIDDLPLDDPIRQIFVQIVEIANDLQNQIELLIVDEPDNKNFDGAATSGDIENLLSSVDQFKFELSEIDRISGKKILIVDDDKINRSIFSRRLEQRGLEVFQRANGVEALEFVNSQSVDLILLDLLMPGMNGIEVLEKIKLVDGYANIPILIISGLDDPRSIVMCLRRGATDYLSKPVELSVLEIKIASALEKNILQSNLEQMALYDQLTGLFNRHSILSALEEFESAYHEDGTDIGDQALQHLSKVVGQVIRGQDLFGRLGGEEFIIGSHHISFPDFIDVSERVRKAVETNTMALQEEILPFTVSGGIYHSTTGFNSMAEALKTSDQNLYNAKNRGRNRVEID
jgi:diguanylate cyclase (GGDEF)-like protein